MSNINNFSGYPIRDNPNMIYSQQYYNDSSYRPNQQINYPNTYINRIPTIPGRIIQSIDEVTPNEIPMDGNIGVFVKEDLSIIYIKRWTKDGTIKTFEYPIMIPATEEQQNKEKEQENTLNLILQRFDKIENILQKKNYSYNNYKNKNKKNIQTDENNRSK